MIYISYILLQRKWKVLYNRLDHKPYSNFFQKIVSEFTFSHQANVQIVLMTQFYVLYFQGYFV